MNTVAHSPGLLHQPLGSGCLGEQRGCFLFYFCTLECLGAQSPTGCVCLIWQWDIGKGWEALEIFGTAKEMVIGL